MTNDLAAASDLIFDKTRHERLTETPWSSDAAFHEIENIVDDFRNAWQKDCSWPTHPRDDETRIPLWRQFDGASGAVVALRSVGLSASGGTDCAGSLPKIYRSYLDSIGERLEPGLQLGEIGILGPAVLADVASCRMIERLHECMAQCVHHPAREITSGATGMMHVALTLFRATQDEQWINHYRNGAASILDSWVTEPNTMAGLWKSEVFCDVGLPARHYYGACHGVAGNAGAIMRGIDLLDHVDADAIVEKTAKVLSENLISDDQFVNWSVSKEPTRGHTLVQWCHGAAGVIVALSDMPQSDTESSKQLDDLLLRAGELVWHAGPLKKMPGICHGTPGNGYAFLSLYHRSGDRKWLKRAQSFAMHSIEQRQQSIKLYNQGRYTLWTGDGGLLTYLHGCLQQKAVPIKIPFPGLEIF